MSILVDGRWVGPHGIGRFAHEVLTRMRGCVRIPEYLPPLSPLNPIWLTAFLAAKKPRAYFSPGFNPPFKSSVPFVFTIHDLIHLRVKEEDSYAKRVYYHNVIRPAARHAFGIITVSEFSKSEIVQWTGIPPERVTVAGNGVSESFSAVGASYDPGFPYLLYVGNRKPHKNLPRVFQAIKTSGLASDLGMVLTGHPDKATVEALARLDLGNKLVFAGAVAESDLPSYYRGAVAVALVSLYEGFGLPALEAMACGTPVLAGKDTALPEVVGDAGVLVDPVSIESIAAGLTQIVCDSELRQQCRQRGLKRAGNFRWRTVAETVRLVMKKASEGRGQE